MKRALTRRRSGADVTPWRELDSVSDRIRRMLDPALHEGFFNSDVWSEDGQWIPAVELVEQDGEYLLTAELPGMSTDDVDVTVEDSVLTLRGEKKTEHEEKNGRAYVRERRYGAFERSFALPRNVDAEKINAEFHDGIVEVHIPKGEETTARRIEIR